MLDSSKKHATQGLVMQTMRKKWGLLLLGSALSCIPAKAQDTSTDKAVKLLKLALGSCGGGANYVGDANKFEIKLISKWAGQVGEKSVTTETYSAALSDLEASYNDAAEMLKIKCKSDNKCIKHTRILNICTPGVNGKMYCFKSEMIRKYNKSEYVINEAYLYDCDRKAYDNFTFSFNFLNTISVK